jgi:hypothetical protein
MVRKNAKKTSCVPDNETTISALTTIAAPIAALTTIETAIQTTTAPTTIKVKKVIKTKKTVELAPTLEPVLAPTLEPTLTLAPTLETTLALALETKPEVITPLEVVKAKRGRKSKKDLLASLSNTLAQPSIQLHINELDSANGANHKIQSLSESELLGENNVIISNVSNKEKVYNENDDITDDVDDDADDTMLVTVADQKPAIKKRGRKPKGGKIIQQVVPINNQKIERPNVILHLKCSMKDLQATNGSSCLIESFNFASKTDLSYELLNGSDAKLSQNMNQIANLNQPHNSNTMDNNNDYDDDDDVVCKDNNKEIWRKLKQLEHNLHVNNINNKKSACFWCTCDFDNPPVYIPKHYINDTYHVYGCFCSPECGVAHLMHESIDSSTKFERYHLLNHIYSKIYEYKKNVKPAPNPYYMLEKYYGNLSIQEYRSLLRNERLFLIVDKPLTRILPELHEDNDEFILNNKIIPSNNYQLKSRMQKKKPNKGSILNEKFGLTNNNQSALIME